MSATFGSLVVQTWLLVACAHDELAVTEGGLGNLALEGGGCHGGGDVVHLDVHSLGEPADSTAEGASSAAEGAVRLHRSLDVAVVYKPN
eukprot:8422415-Pyramimonas_sp.AAC.1